MAATWENDRRHQATCNWNLYGEQRPDPELCNLECLDRPEEVARFWAALDKPMTPEPDGTSDG